MIDKLKLVVKYIHYYIFSSNRHGLQGPFMYQLNEHVFRKDKSTFDQKKIEQLRKQLIANNEVIDVEDFGAGFGGIVTKQKSISEIASRSSKPPKYARLLYRLVNYLQPHNILEIGTSLGISALYQASGNPKANLITLEGCKSTSELAKKNFAMFPELNIEIIQGEFDTTLPSALAKATEFDYVFIDGNHKLIPTLKYFEACAQKMSANGFMVIDDINWSAEMQQAWEKIKVDNRVTISVDLFMVGIVFFNKGFSKENFTVRY